ncbi:DNA repair and recombination protein pif1 [Mucor ambiguus]|uniref:ATP-dependent DNA helicase n=1 Tax=Mucor ambiguus TaxID=91626 RepID=A0A0C9MG14_9FUNG|nr:DNA repair and recombination protein pif1 [Mucor ambiguus]
MTKSSQEQEDEQGYSVDENTYFHPAAGLNGLIITASSPIPALDAMLGKRITNIPPSAIPAKRKSFTSINTHIQAPAKVNRPLQICDSNVPMPSEQIQQDVYSMTCKDQYPLTSSQKARRIMPTQGSLNNRSTQQNHPAQHNKQSTFQASSISANLSIPASTPSSGRIIQAPPIQNNWVKKPTGNNQTSIRSRDPDLIKTLSTEQLAIYDAVVRLGKNIYLTGTAGTGKSVVLKAIINGLQTKYGIDKVAVTASTGLAACHIGGVTVHSEFGIGLGDKDVDYYVKTIGKQGKNFSKIVGLRVLVIDEISMIDGRLFDKISQIAQGLRKSDAAFGGIQLVLCGDFYQLPPINRNSRFVNYAFEADCWDSAIQETMTLTKAFRQTDQHFTDILNELKRGVVSDQTLKELQRLERPLTIHHGIEPTELYPLRKELDTANYGKLSALSGEPIVYKSTDSGYPGLLKHCIAPAEVTLKVNAQVMLTKNLTSTLVNGSRGVVSGFRPDEQNKLYPVVTFTNGEKLMISQYSFTFDSHGYAVATRLQIPLILAWALSIHKSQGQTIEYLRIDLRNSFDYGHAYVALSRVRSLDHLQVLNFSKAVVKANDKVIRFYDQVDRKKRQRVDANAK